LKFVIVADGDVPAAVFEPKLLDGDSDGRPVVIAADGGALKAHNAGLPLSLVIGDADSLTTETVERMRREGIEIQIHRQAKDATDTELCLREALRRGATQIVILGALGGLRFDHAVANLLLLAHPDLAGCDTAVADATCTIRVLSRSYNDRLDLNGHAGDVVSLLPLDDNVKGVRTTGLKYPLAGEPLPHGTTRGVSNVMDGEHAAVTLESGRLAVIHSGPAAVVLIHD